MEIKKEEIRRLREETLNRITEIVRENIERLEENGVNVIVIRDIKDLERVSEEIFNGPVVKAKSNTFEEISLGKILSKKGIEVYETDCGEFIVKLFEESRRNPIRPSQHIEERELIKRVSEKLGRNIKDVEELKEVIKEIVVGNIKKGKIALFGANAVADGSIFLLENEGNMARLFEKKRAVFIAGWEKFCENIEDALFLCRAQAYFGVGYDKPSFIHIVSGPSCTGDIGGRRMYGMYSFEEIYFLLIDRERIYNSRYKEVLKCINCGRCSIVCPILEVTSFGNPGPKSLYFEQSWGMKKIFPEIFKCTLCGRCKEECPVGIDHIKIIRWLREDLLKKGMVPEKSKSMIENMRNFGNPLGEVERIEKIDIFCC